MKVSCIINMKMILSLFAEIYYLPHLLVLIIPRDNGPILQKYYCLLTFYNPNIFYLVLKDLNRYN